MKIPKGLRISEFHRLIGKKYKARLYLPRQHQKEKDIETATEPIILLRRTYLLLYSL